MNSFFKLRRGIGCVEPLEARIAPAFAPVLELSGLDGANGFKIGGVADSDQSGVSVSAAGDVNGDGFSDLIIGAEGASPNGNLSGATYVVFGSASGFAPNLNLSALDGTNGFKLSGQALEDHFGRSVSGAGDVNGDGFDDLIIGAHYADAAGTDSGASYVVFGKANGFPPDFNLFTLNGSNGFRFSGAALDGSGASVSGAGDVNGDGFADVIIGAPKSGNIGASFVVFGKAIGFAADVSFSTLNGNSGFRLSGAAPQDNFGASVSGAGDVNGDGFDDVIVGAPSADPSGNLSGASYVVFGRPGVFPPNLNVAGLDGINGFRLDGAAANDLSGFAVSGAGDVNGDGLADLIVGAYRAPTGFASGASYVVFGKTGGFTPSANLSSLDGSNGFRLTGVASGDDVGASVSDAGDVNRDGFDDVIIGGRAASPNGFRSGASYVVFGKPNAFVADLKLATLDGNSGFTVNGTTAGDFSGRAVSGAGDVNGDGVDDLIIGAYLADAGGTDRGASYVIFGQPTPTISINDLSVAEGNSGATLATFTVTLSAPNTQTVTVGYSTADGTAVQPGDYAPQAVTNLIFNPGEISKPVTVSIVGDTTLEPNETFFVDLSGPTNAVLADGRGQATILNDEFDPAALVVTTVADLVDSNDGVVSLREAIIAANANPGLDPITFNIPTPGVQTIGVATPLPAFTEAITIDGYSQPGASANTAAAGSNAVILIELRSTGAPLGTDGLVFTADGNTVRGLAIGGFDGDGIELRSSGNRIEGSFIGVDATGAVLLPNGNPFVDDAGIFINDGSNNIIGGAAPAQRNVITGNKSFGVWIVNTAGAGTASQNLVTGNVIGLAKDAVTVLTDGQGSRGNGYGVLIDGSAQNKVGGVGPGEPNVLSGNQAGGVLIQNVGATGNLVQGNLIGLAVDGTTAASNGTGVTIGNAPGNIIGGMTAAARNVISANGTGVSIVGTVASGNLVQGNFIGTDATGALARGNGTGIVVTSSNNLIGGVAAVIGAAPGNVISASNGAGNIGNGLQIGGSGTGNVVQGNIIGLDATGTIDLGNLDAGIALNGTLTTVGGTVAGTGNIISGNEEGISMSGGGSHLVQGNYIGTDIAGSLDLGNDLNGISLNGSSNNTIGGLTPAARNIIAGTGVSPSNPGNGIGIMFGATGNVVAGNFIGTDRTGTLDLGNAGHGIFIDRASLNTIGGSAAGAGNLISANDKSGVAISGPGIDGTIVQGNLIGTQLDGTTALGNAEHGVLITSFDATNTMIGGTAGFAGNTIAFNAGNGVFAEVGTGTSIRGNAIHSNAGLGIDLGGAGVTPNDPTDADAGPNNLQNFPVLLSAVTGPAGLGLTGMLSSSPNAQFTIEIFTSSTGDPTGYGEGEISLGAATVNTDGNGDAFITFNSGIAVAPGQQITATATSATGDTSEFSQTLIVTQLPPVISIADAAHLEGQAGTSPESFEITLSASSTMPVSVLVSTVDGTATAGSDFTAVNSQLVQFAPGETMKVIAVDLLGDATIEPNETFTVVLSTPTNATIGNGTGTGTIINDDVISPPGDDVVFTDADGDEVTVSLSKGTLTGDALVFEPRGQGFLLQSVDLTAAGSALTGTNLTIKAKTRAGGDGKVNVGTIDATGVILKKVKLDGDVGFLRAGLGGSGKLGIKQLVVESLGKEQNNLFGTTQAGLLVNGGVGNIKVLSDVLNFAAAIGVGQQVGIKQLVVGGRMTGSSFEVGGGFDSLKVAGVLEDTDFTVGGDFKKVSVDQQITGGSFVVGGVLNAATFKQGMRNTMFNAGQAIGTLIVARDVETSTVRAGTTLGNFVVGGSLIDTTVSAPGKLLPRNATEAQAFKIVGVQGDVVRSAILAGYDRDGVGVNPDAGIGKVVIKGRFEASSIAAGASAGADGFFGNADDALLPGGNDVVAKIASITIKGAVLGTAANPADHFGIVAEELGKLKVGGAALPLTPGPRNDLAGIAVGATDDVRAREVT